MKMKLESLQFFAILVVLLLGMPYRFLATAAADTTAAAKRAAKVDAKTDTNEFLWFATGCGVGIATFYFGGIMVDRYANRTTPNLSSNPLVAEKQNEIYANTDEVFVTAVVTGGSTVFLGAHWISKLYRPSPPSGRFLGKPAWYVSLYTDTYKEEKAHIQSKWMDWGLLAGGVAGALYVVQFLWKS